MSNSEISYQGEIYRKLIHLCGILLPVSFVAFERNWTLIFLTLVFILTLSIDILSKKGMPLHVLVFKYLGFMIRGHERDQRWYILNGASWITFSALIIFYFFPRDVAFTSFLVLIFSDLTAALIGRKFGKVKILKKSLEGTIAFFISATAISTICFLFLSETYQFLFFCIAASLVASIIELFSGELRLDDNLSVPISYCLTYLALEALI